MANKRYNDRSCRKASVLFQKNFNSKANIYLGVFINKIDDFETFTKNVKFSQFIKIQYGRRISGLYAEKLLLH